MAEEETSAEEVVEEKKEKAAVPWIPLVLVLLFIPIITLVLVQLVVIPKLKSSLAADSGQPAGEHEMAEPEAEDHGGGDEGGGHGGGHGGGEEAAPAGRGNTVTFEDVISNVAGTMGTRFLKVSFQIVSEDEKLASVVRSHEAQVRDAIISTLSSRTIQEIEVIGGRNSLRVALISSINGAIGKNLVKDLYFIDFIIQ